MNRLGHSARRGSNSAHQTSPERLVTRLLRLAASRFISVVLFCWHLSYTGSSCFQPSRRHHDGGSRCLKQQISLFAKRLFLISPFKSSFHFPSVSPDWFSYQIISWPFKSSIGQSAVNKTVCAFFGFWSNASSKNYFYVLFANRPSPRGRSWMGHDATWCHQALSLVDLMLFMT